MNVKIISIGDELLQGITLNTNANFLAQRLVELGFVTEKVSTIGDTRLAITNELEESAGKFNLVLITGGLGPTSDDITKPVMCEFFGGELLENADVLQDVTNFVKIRGHQLNENNRKQALVPTSCRVIRNRFGTAPGMLFEKNQTFFVAMPGVPFEMEKMFVNDVIPLLHDLMSIKPSLVKIVHVFGIPESDLAHKLEDFEAWLPENFRFAYLPSPEGIKLKIISFGCNNPRVKELLDEAVKRIQKAVGEFIFGYDNDTLEMVLGRLLKSKNATLATAESCTGGHIGHKITSISGSSDYFKGGIISYSNEVKINQLGVKKETLEKFGAVSNQTVTEMANGALKVLETHYAVAVSGIAGPNGGTEQKPVGTVYIAVVSKKNCIVEHFRFGNMRDINIRRTTAMAMFMLIRMIERENL